MESRGPRLALTCLCTLAIVLAALQPAHGTAAATVDALQAIVGRWQSDVVDGRSALSDCIWTPQRTAVLCEQTIAAPNGVQHALNLFTFDAATSQHFLYVVPTPGRPAARVRIVIEGPRWIYGGETPAPGERRVRTINDFSAHDSYTWWTESSADGEQWTRVTGGRSTRVGARGGTDGGWERRPFARSRAPSSYMITRSAARQFGATRPSTAPPALSGSPRRTDE